MNDNSQRIAPLQFMLSADELAALDAWRCTRHMQSRAAAMRELLRLGLAQAGHDVASDQEKSSISVLLSGEATGFTEHDAF